MKIQGMQERTDGLLMLHAEYLKRKYNAEIEQAVNKVKKPKNEWDKWFRKEWHKAKWRRIKGYRRPAKKRAGRL